MKKLFRDFIKLLELIWVNCKHKGIIHKRYDSKLHQTYYECGCCSEIRLEEFK